jgi:hypothetical protein
VQDLIFLSKEQSGTKKDTHTLTQNKCDTQRNPENLPGRCGKLRQHFLHNLCTEFTHGASTILLIEPIGLSMYCSTVCMYIRFDYFHWKVKKKQR